MWIIVVSFCASFEGSDHCNSYVSPVYFRSRQACESRFHSHELSVTVGTERENGDLFYFEARCSKAKAACTAAGWRRHLKGE